MKKIKLEVTGWQLLLLLALAAFAGFCYCLHLQEIQERNNESIEAPSQYGELGQYTEWHFFNWSVGLYACPYRYGEYQCYRITLEDWEYIQTYLLGE